MMKKEKKITVKEARKQYKENHKMLRNENIQSFVSLQGINKVYPNKVQAVFNFNLEIDPHDFIVLVGPSGCGKSTTLRMIAGLEEISSGYLYINQQLANYLPSKDRGIAMVFQSYALYPHMTVYENMSYGLRVKKEWLPKLDKKTKQPIVAINHEKIEELKKKLSSLDETKVEERKEIQLEIETLEKNPEPIYVLRKYTEKEIKEKVFNAANFLDLGAYLDRKPKELSGGQMQRVALGRALVRNSKLFLMDEPLSNLDAKLRVSMRSEIVRIHKNVGATTIYVTHDQTEAMTMATKIVVMNKGWIQQIGSPREIYMNPENLFVATFIGAPAMNIFSGTYDQGIITLEDGTKLEYAKRLEDQHQEFYKQKLEFWKTLLKRIHHPGSLKVKEQVESLLLKIKNNELKNPQEILKETSLFAIDELLEDIAIKVQDELDALEDIKEKDPFRKTKMMKILKRILEILSDKEDSVIDLELQKIQSFKAFTQNKDSGTQPVESIPTTMEEKKQKIQEIIQTYEQYLKGSHAVKIGIRPEDLTLVREKESSCIDVNTTIVELIGSDYYVHSDLSSTDLIAKVPNHYIIRSGAHILLKVNMEKLHLFDDVSGQKITRIEEVNYVDLL
mgnify:FL=1